MARIFGITGGIGMGKSTVGDLLARRGAAMIDTDALARQVVEPGQPALAEIVQRFGRPILRSDGALNRRELAHRIFPDDQARADLEAILHPRIHAIWAAEVQRWRADAAKTGSPGFGAVIIPLLFETNSAPLLDAVVCVACSTASQMQRLHKRGWNEQEIQQRLRAQWPTEKKIAQSNYVVWTDTPMDAVAEQLDRILEWNGAPK